MSSHSLVPVNLEEERSKFFFDTLYNPQFIYENLIPSEYLVRYGAISSELTKRAQAICDEVLKKWETDSNFLEKAPAEIVLKEKELFKALERELQSLEDKISELEGIE